ncbi:hypothetical protein CJF42_00865 [Pseudoalteromonas sp. NBT06-2]|uniref:alpha/beta fold hydrolase n=1 Tax=Pseudoalteromonas sp. NBT06-2 TaxID=2025950 RepID=UPI000BA63260|nr:alpha/beta hydrolase [Pseudoalteromonas sp. NBT06-2]PAJ76274.1 hypothetical protein CJF42_00865 [Pseudoalteromonas sp. NBT06-2]
MSTLPILILPGTLCTEAMFTQQILHLKQFTDNVSVVQFTNETSLSEMADKVIQATHKQPVAIIGFSMGGIVALEVAKTHPHLIAKLAMVNSNCHADLPHRKANRSSQIKQAQSGELLSLIKDVFMPNYLNQQRSDWQKLIIDMALTLGTDCFSAQVMAIEDRPDGLHILQALAADILIIGGLQDNICPVEHQLEMHKALPDSDLILLGNCGHFSPLEQTDKVSNALSQWYLSNNN